MRRCEAWSRFAGNDAVAIWKRAASLLNLGRPNVLPMNKPCIYRLLTSYGWDVGAPPCPTNTTRGSYRYHVLSPSPRGRLTSFSREALTIKFIRAVSDVQSEACATRELRGYPQAELPPFASSS